MLAVGFSDAQQPADAGGVDLGNLLGTVEATGAAGGLAFQVVTLSRPGVGEPAGAGDLDPLLRSGMRLVLRHGFFAHIRCWSCWIAACVDAVDRAGHLVLNTLVLLTCRPAG